MKSKKDISTISIQHINSTEAFQQLESEWGELFLKSTHQSAFLTWEWLFSWWQVYQRDRKLWLLTARDNNQLVGILPLMSITKKKYGIPFRTLVPLGSPHCDVSGVVYKNDDREIFRSLAEFLISQKQHWDILELNNYIQASIDYKEICSYLEQAGLSFTQKTYDHFYISIENPWEEFLSQLSKKFRKNLRRAARLAEESGNISFIHLTGNEVTWTAFNTVIEINRHSNYPIIYTSKDEQDFHRELISRMPAKNFMSIFLLSIDNQPVAYEYGFTVDHKFEAWRAGYNLQIDPTISIGKLLSSMIVETTHSLKYQKIDFLRGAEAYKLEWKPSEEKYIKSRFIKKNHLASQAIFIWLPGLKSMLRKRVNN